VREVTNLKEFQDGRLHSRYGNLWNDYKPRLRHKLAQARLHAAVELLPNSTRLIKIHGKTFAIRGLDNHVASITVRRQIIGINVVGKHKARIIGVVEKGDYHDSNST
jgi:hypothetical protein